jgi:yeast amino acid transporter
MLFNVVMALGELAVVYPIAGSFSIYSSRFIDPAWGFAMGWNYALQWLVVLPLELTAAAMTINYWDKSINSGVWITIFLVTVVIINLFGVKGYGEAEFLFSMVKITAVVGFIILGIVICVGGAPQGGYLGAKTWVDPGAFNNGFQVWPS